MCRVSTVYAHRILVRLDRFSKIRFFVRFWTMEKKKSENEEKSWSEVGLFVILDNVYSSRSWSPENWRLVHNQSRSVQMYKRNQLISNHLKDFILDDIQTINFLPSCLYYMVLSGSRSPKRSKKASLRFWLRVVSYFSFGHGRMRARASGERRSREKRGMTDIFFAIYWCSCVSISFIFSIIP